MSGISIGNGAVCPNLFSFLLLILITGDNLTISGMVTYINDAYKQIEIKASIINQNHKKVSKALIKVGLIDE